MLTTKSDHNSNGQLRSRADWPPDATPGRRLPVSWASVASGGSNSDRRGAKYGRHCGDHQQSAYQRPWQEAQRCCPFETKMLSLSSLVSTDSRRYRGASDRAGDPGAGGRYLPRHRLAGRGNRRRVHRTLQRGDHVKIAYVRHDLDRRLVHFRNLGNLAIITEQHLSGASRRTVTPGGLDNHHPPPGFARPQGLDPT